MEPELNPILKAQIDGMSLRELLAEQRFAHPESIKFTGPEGAYRLRRLAELREQDEAAYVAASKAIGW